MDAHLRAGVAVYNAGEYHAAHDAWEDRWLDLPEGSDDERLLHGLIQFTAAVHHASGRNWRGATGLADSAADYLSEIPDDYRGVNVAAVRSYLRRLAADPERIERAGPPRLRVDGRALTYDDLRFDAAAVAAVVIAEEYGYDETVVERAVEFARADLDAERTGSPFVALVLDFPGAGDRRSVVFQRLTEHVGKRRSREADVDGLFE
jgi:hypothetical protein